MLAADQNQACDAVGRMHIDIERIGVSKRHSSLKCLTSTFKVTHELNRYKLFGTCVCFKSEQV